MNRYVPANQYDAITGEQLLRAGWSMGERGWDLRGEVRPFCNETAESCVADCHCGDGACEAARGESVLSCDYDCFCGDGQCDPLHENWLNCSLDCTEPTCGNGVCECTRNGLWGAAAWS